MVLCTSKDKATLYKETENKLIRPTTPTFSSPHACETRLIGCWTSSVFQGVEALNSISKDKQFEPSTDAHRKQGVECGFEISIFMIRLSKYPCSLFFNVKNVHLICASSHHLSVASLTLVKFQPCELQRSTAGEIQQCQLYGFSRGFSKVGGMLLDMLPELELLFAPLQREKNNARSQHLMRDGVRTRDLGLDFCAYWADNQSYRITGSVQQEQESSPLTTRAEPNGRHMKDMSYGTVLGV